MATVHQLPERRYAHQSTGWLLSTVVNDSKELLAQELDAAKHEIRHQIELAKRATVAAAIGGGVFAVGAIVLAFAASQLLALTALPLWGSLAIVGGGLALIGGILLIVGVSKAKQIEPLATQTMLEAKKDVRWIKNEATSGPT